MNQEIVKNQYVISLRNGMTAHIIADDVQTIAVALQDNKFFNTKENMLINTADIVAVMPPFEYDEQKRYMRGWYKNSTGISWYNKKGEFQEDTALGKKYNTAVSAMSKVETKEDAIQFVEKLNSSQVKSIVEKLDAVELQRVIDLSNELSL